MGSQGAAEVLYGRQAKKAADPAAYIAAKEEEYHDTVSNPYVAAQRGYIDDIIVPATTRSAHHQGAGIVAQQARHQSDEEARQHSSVIGWRDHQRTGLCRTKR